jgi:hypothetical protein
MENASAETPFLVGLTKEAKHLIQTTKCVVLVCGGLSVEERELYATALKTSLQTVTAPAIRIENDDDVLKFRKATSLFNGIASFICVIEDFSHGRFFVAPLGASPVLNTLCSWTNLTLQQRSVTSIDAATEYFTSFFSRVQDGQAPKAKQGARLQCQRDGAAQTAVLETFAPLAFDSTANTIVILSTSTCPVCPVAVEFVETVLDALSACEPTSKSHVRLRAVIYNVGENDLLPHPDSTAEDVEKLKSIRSVPRIRLYRPGHPTAPIDYEGPREFGPFVAFLRKHMLPHCKHFPFAALAKRLGSCTDDAKFDVGQDENVCCVSTVTSCKIVKPHQKRARPEE